ncbi:MAG: symmetrical bis(5'-nucleosyl)-tetraphosphatase [Gammaproteobacteria bacterium]|nr:symmetrical bis(5'-nucleosyl)-tetraphosphatase [Gammaproteobacteria bacterium]
MATYAIGDIHGCFPELKALLKKIKFDPEKDCLWFAGDLVNRGGHSLEVLRFIKNLGTKHIIVLGNNDLSLITVYYGYRKNNLFDEILAAPDRDELVEWLRQQKLLHHDPVLNFVLTHAGIYPYWTLEQAKTHAKEVENILHGELFKTLLKELFGNTPNKWSNDLMGSDRYRFIVNAFTRMRYCTEDGVLDFMDKGPIGTQKSYLVPWYQAKNRQKIDARILFGHWASLLGKTSDPNLFALDTGCGWGHQLTALRLQDLRRFSVTKQ